MFKSIVSRVRCFPALCVAAVVGLTASPAFATTPFAGVTIDTTDYMLVAVVIVTALAGFWAVKRLMGLLGR